MATAMNNGYRNGENEQQRNGEWDPNDDRCHLCSGCVFSLYVTNTMFYLGTLPMTRTITNMPPPSLETREGAFALAQHLPQWQPPPSLKMRDGGVYFSFFTKPPPLPSATARRRGSIFIFFTYYTVLYCPEMPYMSYYALRISTEAL